MLPIWLTVSVYLLTFSSNLLWGLLLEERMTTPVIKFKSVGFSRPTFIRSQHKGYVIKSEILKDIDLTITEGSRVALMGLNGAGKTTLLQLMGGILVPTKGSIQTNGKISTMLTSSIGIKDIATGYENIKIMATLMGIEHHLFPDVRKFVEDFTGLGEKLKSPVKTYSNGMRTRLGFAIATYLDPDIFLIDEVISAGDEVFRAKAKQRIQDIMMSSGIVVLASHGIGVLRQFCNKALLMDQGSVLFYGDLEEGIVEFRKMQQLLKSETQS